MSELGFRVTDTRQIDTLTPAGTTTTIYRVWLVTDRGATGSLDVSMADWKTETLAPILAKKAQELDLAFAMMG